MLPPNDLPGYYYQIQPLVNHFDGICISSASYLDQNTLSPRSSQDLSCDLPEFNCNNHPQLSNSLYSQPKDLHAPFHGHPNIYPPLPSSMRPTQQSKQSARRFRGDPSNSTTYVDAPMDIYHVGLKCHPASLLQDPEVVTRDTPSHDDDGGYMDPGPSTFRPSPISSEGLLSPLSFHHEWEPSTMPFPDHAYHSIVGHDHRAKLSPLGDLQTALKGISDTDDDSPFRRSYSSPESECDECLSPGSMTTETETDTDDESLMSSISSLPPPLDPYRPYEPLSDHDCDTLSPGQCFSSCKSHSTGHEPIYHLEEYPRTSSIVSPFNSYPQPIISPLCPNFTASNSTSPPLHATSIFSPTSLLPAFELSPPSPLYGLYDDFSLSGIPSSPSRRRSSSLPDDDEEDVGEGGSGHRSSDPFGLGSDALYDEPSSYLSSPNRTRFLSLPGADTDDDLIPLHLASKNYIPDPTVGDFSAPIARSLLLWDTHSDGDVDVPTPRSPSPEMFYLPPSVLAECQDEEMQKVYELRERTARTSAAVRGDRKGRWERERCRELSALLRLKLDERGVFPSGSSSGNGDDKSSTGADMEVPTSSEETPTIILNPPSSSSLSPSLASSSFQLPLKPNPKTSLSPSSSASKYPQITSMAQLVANMVFHRQDALKRYFARTTPSRLNNPPVLTATSPKAPAALPISRSPLSQVILPEGMEEDGDGDEAVSGIFVETGVEGVSAVDGHDEGRELCVTRGCEDRPRAHRAATDPQIRDGWSSPPSLVCGLPTVDQVFARAETI